MSLRPTAILIVAYLIAAYFLAVVLVGSIADRALGSLY